LGCFDLGVCSLYGIINASTGGWLLVTTLFKMFPYVSGIYYNRILNGGIAATVFDYK
jgi:hypothetical protein